MKQEAQCWVKMMDISQTAEEVMGREQKKSDMFNTKKAMQSMICKHESSPHQTLLETHPSGRCQGFSTVSLDLLRGTFIPDGLKYTIKEFKEGRAYFGSQFEGSVHRDKNECWYQLTWSSYSKIPRSEQVFTPSLEFHYRHIQKLSMIQTLPSLQSKLSQLASQKVTCVCRWQLFLKQSVWLWTRTRRSMWEGDL